MCCCWPEGRRGACDCGVEEEEERSADANGAHVRDDAVRQRPSCGGVHFLGTSAAGLEQPDGENDKFGDGQVECQQTEVEVPHLRRREVVGNYSCQHLPD